MGIPTRLIHEVGSRAYLRVYWGNDCPSCGGSRHVGYHNAQRHLADSKEIQAWTFAGQPEDYPATRWPAKCDHCDAIVPPEARRQVFPKRLYDTASGDPEPGDLYFDDYLHSIEDGVVRCVYWDNCTSAHLYCVLPNGRIWDIDSRANNCTQPDERTHRCWVRHGDPPNVHVDKAGHTCAAGAGSIMAGDFHGHLHGGHVVSC